MSYKKLIDKEGNPVPGVTTIIDTNLGWNKKILIDWYYNQMNIGRDPKKLNAEAKKTGSVVHEFIECFEKNKKISNKKLSEYKMDDILIAENILSFYKELKKQHNIEIISQEESFVSEQYKYGGRIDLYGKVDGIFSLIDVKPSKGKIYADHLIQLGAYNQLLKENKKNLDNYYVISYHKDLSIEESVTLHNIPNIHIEKGFEVFKLLLQLNSMKDIFYENVY